MLCENCNPRQGLTEPTECKIALSSLGKAGNWQNMTLWVTRPLLTKEQKGHHSLQDSCRVEQLQDCRNPEPTFEELWPYFRFQTSQSCL